jgi:hypothetical protein
MDCALLRLYIPALLVGEVALYASHAALPMVISKFSSNAAR